MEIRPESNEAMFEAVNIQKVNGWEIGQIGQELGKQAATAIKKGWEFKNARLVLLAEVHKL